MKKIVATALVVTLATPLQAQESEGEGFDLMREGARMLFRGLVEEMGPAIDDLQGLSEELQPRIREFAQEMGPALRDLMTEVEDWSVYHPPEMQPNGDILLRRKTPEEMDTPEAETESAPNAEVEL